MLTLPKRLYQELVLDAKKQLPNEACGILSGNSETISSLYILSNKENTPTRFYVNEYNVTHTLQAISKKGEEPIAIYHSHPTSRPRPSQTDIRQHPDKKVKMIILSLKETPYSISCFTIKDNTFKDYPLRLERGE